ncbi:MAG TPA: alkaline phosphatase family protein [Candidatus Binatia bacterium]|nr:alkaline phosphatase family protein [Candidatus Binatia bacterium]
MSSPIVQTDSRSRIFGSIAKPIFFSLFLASLLAPSVWGETPIGHNNWGTVTGPVYGSSEVGVYAGAELFAGPNKFGSYFAGVLPNGRIVTPAGTTIQIGMNPLGVALTPDGKYLVTSNNDERETNLPSYQSPTNKGGYSLSVIDTPTMQVVSQYNVSGRFFVGLQVTGTGPYTVWASGGGDNDVKLFTVSTAGAISPAATPRIVIVPIQPSTNGFVSNYTPGPLLNTADANGNKPPVPSGFNRTTGAQTTFPAGSALSPDGRYLYVACNGDNSLAVIDTSTLGVVAHVPVGYFPYAVSVSASGDKIAVSNWGVTEYKFANPTYDGGGQLIALGTTGQNQPDGFYVAPTSTSGPNPKTSSVSLLSAPEGNVAALGLLGSTYEGHKLDELYNVGDTHPSATAIVRQSTVEVLYVTKSNSDSLGVILLNTNHKRGDVDLAPVSIGSSGFQVHGAYPNALAVSPDNNRLYIAEAGINAVAVLDTTNPLKPVLLGRIPTGWYPTALAVSADGRFLYVANAKGIGEDINPNIITTTGNPPPSGIGSDPNVDSNYIFGTLQKVDLSNTAIDNSTVLHNNFVVTPPADTSVVPVGGAASKKIEHVFFILHENKTFDSMLGNLSTQFGPFASLTFNNRDGSPYTNGQYTGVAVNTQALATAFATAVNYYSDSEESDAGHQFAASGTATDYTEKTLLVKTGRGLLVNKNFEPEDYPESGYIFNNAARQGVSFKDYGALIRIEGTDTGTSTPTTLNDPLSGNVGYPKLQGDNFHVTNPLMNAGDVTSPTSGLGQSYFLVLPVLAILGGNNQNEEPRLDRDYPGYNFNISDQRRALEFIADFDRMLEEHKLPTFMYIYQPNDHTGGVQAPNAATVGTSPLQQIADSDVALGMVIQHIMQSPVYYNPKTKQGSAIFVTWDDAQSSLDHIHPHRTPLLVISPYAKPGFVAKRHYCTASIVKTEELLLGLPPNNLGDLFATDLRDMFQSTYNGITAANIGFTVTARYTPSPEGQSIWALAHRLDTSAPDRDSRRLGALTRLSLWADELHADAAQQNRLESAEYKKQQEDLFEAATRLVRGPAPKDSDG